MRVGTIYYNEKTDMTEVKWSDNFAVSEYLTKMDVLKDMRGITWMAYEYVYENHDTPEGDDGYIPQSIEG